MDHLDMDSLLESGKFNNLFKREYFNKIVLLLKARKSSFRKVLLRILLHFSKVLCLKAQVDGTSNKV